MEGMMIGIGSHLRPDSVAVAAGAIVTALLNVLVEKGVLSIDDVRRLLVTASNETATRSATSLGPDVERIFRALDGQFGAEGDVKPGAQ
jgi:hypothetical protein